MVKEDLYWREIEDFEIKYYDLIKDFDLNFPKCLNLQKEKKKFFAALADDKIYNPYFKYAKRNFDGNSEAKLKKLKISTKNDLYGFKRLYKERLKTKIYEIECHKNWGNQISTKFVRKYRGEPSRILLSRAKVFCNNFKREKVKFKTLTHEEVSFRLKEKVKELTGDELNVIFIEIPSKVNITPKAKLMKINPHTKLTSLDVKRLSAHEICVHYMRYYNGSLRNIKILESGTSNYIETEEGLAVYAEEMKGVLSKAQMFIYAGRVIATYYTLRMSFYDVFKKLKSYGFENEEAFAITTRAKRNLSDTSQFGGFTKDYVYFSGYLKIKKYAKNHNIDDLFIGKVKIEDLKILKKYLNENRDKIKKFEIC